MAPQCAEAYIALPTTVQLTPAPAPPSAELGMTSPQFFAFDG